MLCLIVHLYLDLVVIIHKRVVYVAFQFELLKLVEKLAAFFLEISYQLFELVRGLTEPLVRLKIVLYFLSAFESIGYSSDFVGLFPELVSVGPQS
jgi:hypothetical protein